MKDLVADQIFKDLALQLAQLTLKYVEKVLESARGRYASVTYHNLKFFMYRQGYNVYRLQSGQLSFISQAALALILNKYRGRIIKVKRRLKRGAGWRITIKVR